jgi:large subunit ribosomal protein L17
MKKNIATYRLNRDTSARQALFKNLMVALVTHESIQTTKTKAAAVQGLFEKLLTRAKEGTIPARKAVQTVLQNAKLVKKMVDDIAPRYQAIKGGYTKTIVVGTRKGDNAVLVQLMLTKRSENSVKPETKAIKPEIVKKTAKKEPISIIAPKVEHVNTARVAPRRGGSRGGDR